MGQTLDLSGATLPLSAKGLQAVQGGTGWFETATVQDEPLLIYSQSYIGRRRRHRDRAGGLSRSPSPSSR